MSKRQKRAVRITHAETFDTRTKHVFFRWSKGSRPFDGFVQVQPGEDVWQRIADYLDSEEAALMGEEREV